MFMLPAFRAPLICFLYLRRREGVGLFFGFSAGLADTFIGVGTGGARGGHGPRNIYN